MSELPRDIIQKIQNHTGFPWWNGAAYADYRGYPGRIRHLEAGVGEAVDDLAELMNWMRQEKQYDKADRLRTIIGRLARLQHSDALDDGLIRKSAMGWK